MKQVKIVTRKGISGLEAFEKRLNQNLENLQNEGNEILEIKEIYREGKLNAFMIVYKK